jgi:putative ABC transport system permease protein
MKAFRLEALLNDVRYAFRGLARSPGFTSAAVLTLALGIGANSAIFSVVDAVLLDPLAFPEPDRLVSIRASAPGSDLPEEFGPGAEFLIQYRDAKLLEDLGFFGETQTTVRAGNQVERLFVSPASPSLFTTLGVKPVLGRLPTEKDEDGQVVVMSHRLWMTWFGGDPSILGRPLEVSGTLRTVIGVMGPDFRFPLEQTSLWLHDLITEPVRPGNFGLNLVGRMRPGADHGAVAAELGPLARRLPERFGGSPTYARIIERHRPIVRSLEDELVGDIARPLWILLGTVVLVLLIACANVANLLAVRAEGRIRDLALRRALGAGRAALIRSQMAEALVLAAAGGAGGALLAWVGVPLLVRAAPESVPRLSTVGLDSTALLFTAGVAILAACISGFLPAVRFSSGRIMSALAHSGRVGARRSRLAHDALVVLQTAAALILLVASGLLVQSFRALNDVDPGYETENIFTFQMAPDDRQHGLIDGPTYARFHYAFMDRLAAMPGVESVGVVNELPLDEGANRTRIATRRTDTNGDVQPLVRFTVAGGDYFQTMGIRLLRGSYFARNANPTSEVTAVVSASAAVLLWPGEDPIGQGLRLPQAPGPNAMVWMTVGGVVEDVMLADFRQRSPEPLVYLPMVGATARSWAVGTPAYVVRTERAETIAAEIREVIRQVAPEAPMYRVFTMAELAARSMAALSFTMLTLAIAAGLALILGAVGLYGVLSYVVSQRTREIGIRMALGAQADNVRRLVVARGVGIALVGVAIGLLGAIFLTRVLDTLLFGVEALNVVNFVAMSVVMLGVALAASYGPARRASAVDPMVSLRAE